MGKIINEYTTPELFMLVKEKICCLCFFFSLAGVLAQKS